jgi:hypothetical protein
MTIADTLSVTFLQKLAVEHIDPLQREFRFLQISKLQHIFKIIAVSSVDLHASHQPGPRKNYFGV